MNGTEIRIARIRLGLKQYELAQRAGLRETELSLIENNRKRVSDGTLARIMTALEGVQYAVANG